MPVVDALFEGSLDIVGDIHGEFHSLCTLLAHLGYDNNGSHPDGRRLVFVGDLVDRGPDSPAVVEKVLSFVMRGSAQCILGNHELNLLLNSQKHGSEWFFPQTAYDGPPMKPVTGEQRQRFLEFFQTMPLALERSDLRIVHACWHHNSINELKAFPKAGACVPDMHGIFQKRIEETLESSGLRDAYDREKERYGDRIQYGHADPYEHWPHPVLLDAHGDLTELKQMGNPVKILTSGVERKTATPFPASGKFRFADRVKWWEEYSDDTPVIVGHYWRKFREVKEKILKDLPPDLFDGISPDEWMGPRQKVYCVDFSVGLSAQKRAKNEPTDGCSLAALRWPEKTVVFDDGTKKVLRRRWSADEYRRAWNFASAAHDGQTVPGQSYAYINHIGAVAMEVLACLQRERQWEDPNLAVQCALLHDCLEDTGTTYSELATTFGDRVADGVLALTKERSLSSGVDRMADSLDRIQGQPKEIWMLKMADRITNLQPPPPHWSHDKVAGYREEARLILNRLGDASPYLSSRLAQAIRRYRVSD